MGHAYAVMAQYEQAFAELDKALSIDPDNYMAIWIHSVVSEEVAENETPASDQAPDLGLEKGLSFGS
jgi:Tfp pilus assembly protein PilF